MAELNNQELFDQISEGVKEDDSLVIGGLDQYDMTQFYKYLMGQSLEAPEALNKMMNNLINKISMSLGFTVVNNIARQTDLAKYLAEAEKELFNPNDIPTKTEKELKESYKEARNTLMGLQEFSRKFVVQNRDSLKMESSRQEKLMNKLLALPPEKLESVYKIIEDAEKEKEQSSTPQAVEEQFSEDILDNEVSEEQFSEDM